MAYFPFMIQLDDKQCLIVGGGAVAARKAAQMCEFGACVTVVAPEICAELLAIADMERIDETAGIVENIDGNCQKKPERIRVWKREVTEADISGMDVVIMATDDAELNSQYAELCRSKHILVNVVDVKKDCDFYFPAIIKQGEVVVSVSTGGNSPMLASKIKKDIRQTLRTDYGQIADELGAIREKILAEEPDERARKRRFAAIVEAKMQEQRIRIGTRGSRLAQIQTDMVIEQLKKRHPELQLYAIGTNSAATTSMMKAGADFGATGENPCIVNAKNSDIIIGPIGIVMANSLLGEITPAIATAIGDSHAFKILIPVNRCNHYVVGCQEAGLGEYIRLVCEKVDSMLS